MRIIICTIDGIDIGIIIKTLNSSGRFEWKPTKNLYKSNSDLIKMKSNKPFSYDFNFQNHLLANKQLYQSKIVVIPSQPEYIEYMFKIKYKEYYISAYSNRMRRLYELSKMGNFTIPFDKLHNTQSLETYFGIRKKMICPDIECKTSNNDILSKIYDHYLEKMQECSGWFTKF